MLGLKAPLTAVAVVLASPAVSQPVDDTAHALEEIVVTAQKREQSLIDVPISISVTNAEQIERNRARELRDLSRLVSNFSIQRQGSIDTVFIRGVGGGGRNIGFTTRAGVYVDGVYAGQFAALNQDTLDIARIEVLRGPQGQMFGRNTVSGAVSIVTEQPNDDFSGYVEGEYGNRDLIELRGAINLPLADGVAMRFSGAHREREGFTYNVPTGTDLDNINRDSARFQLAAELSDRARLDIAADYSRDDTNKMLGEAITDTFGIDPTPLPGKFDTPYNRIPVQDIEVVGASATFSYDLSDSAEFVSISAYRWTDWHRENDLDYVPYDFFHFRFHDRFSQYSQEARVAFGKGSAVSGVAGLYFAHETARSARSAITGAEGGLLPFGLAEGDSGDVSATIKSRSLAAFAAVDWALNDIFTLNLGARYSHDRRRLLGLNIDGPPAFQLAYEVDYNDRLSQGSIDPSIGITARLSDAATLYAKYARGFKSGGWNIDFVDAAGFADSIRFSAERVNNFEGGIKGESSDRRLRYAVSAFHATYDDYQIDQFVDLGGGQTSIMLRNAAKATSWGGEASIQAAPITGLLIGVDLGYSKAKFDHFPNGGGNGIALDGMRLPYAPRFTSAVNARYEWPVSFGTAAVGFNWNYRSVSYSGPENRTDQKIDGRNLVDARVELAGTDKRWSLAVWARNLFNEDYIDNRIFDFFQTRAVEYGEPRTYGITARIGF